MDSLNDNGESVMTFKAGDICLTDYYLWYNPKDYIGAIVELGLSSSGFDFTISKHICVPKVYLNRNWETIERAGVGWGVRTNNLKEIHFIHDMLPDFQRAAHVNATYNFKKFLRDLLTKEFGEIPEESLEVSSNKARCICFDGGGIWSKDCPVCNPDDTLGVASAEGISNEDFLSIEKPKVRSYSGLAPGGFNYKEWIHMSKYMR